MLAAVSLLLAAHPADDFATRLWRALPASTGNVVVSPTSLQACLGLLVSGVGPTSRAPLAAALGASVAGLPAVDRDLRARLRALAQGGEATVSNAGFFAAPPSPAYAAAVRAGYDAEIARLRSGEAGLAQVNEWANAHTKGRIPRLLDGLDGAAAAVILNAVTFDGRWRSPFAPEETRKRPFAAPTGSRPVETMHLEGERFAYAKGKGFGVVALPYEGGRYRMAILLPDAGDPAATLRSDARRRALAEAKETDLDLTLPKFSLRSSPAVERALKGMGLAPLFRRADLRPAVPSGRIERLDAVVQKTYLEVGEKGTKAAAATGMVFSKAVRRPVAATPFHVDRPFAFVLQHVGTGEPLFVGVVREP